MHTICSINFIFIYVRIFYKKSINTAPYRQQQQQQLGGGDGDDDDDSFTSNQSVPQ